jgi:hypothetical protein
LKDELTVKYLKLNKIKIHYQQFFSSFKLSADELKQVHISGKKTFSELNVSKNTSLYEALNF